ncbi:hypothetical protein AVEN_16681-1 [Araneus ventricosus]|uniref:Histone-lysine N-methyltransferase SETMAR n=1 Tax=Araneus ventricosus TaxID=182803 RepID=A0A4Y2ARQ3_ARAVE|nr:hypothetical protein AVEN_16681-1 [Araneus ventricosus]
MGTENTNRKRKQRSSDVMRQEEMIFFKGLSQAMKHGFVTRHLQRNGSHWNGGKKTQEKPETQESKATSFFKKIMCNVFWDCQGILLADWMERGTTINATAYCETLMKLRRSIQNKGVLLISGTVFVHENARPHTARVTTTLLD